MKRLPCFIVAAAFWGAFGAFAQAYAQPLAYVLIAQAATTPSSASVPNAGDLQYKTMVDNASKMMGYVAVANIALLHNLIPEATTNTAEALSIARTLEDQTRQFNMEMMKLGKLKYGIPGGKEFDYWLPVVDDQFAVDTMDAVYLKTRANQPDIAEEDAQMLSTKVALDTKTVRDALDKASEDIKAKNYSDAQFALMTAASSTFSFSAVNEEPLATARDNLLLAKLLSKNRDYKGAAFALDHAKSALKLYMQTATPEQKQKADKLEADIEEMQKQIEQNKPDFLQTIDNRIHVWLQDLASWSGM